MARSHSLNASHKRNHEITIFSLPNLATMLDDNVHGKKCLTLTQKVTKLLASKDFWKVQARFKKSAVFHHWYQDHSIPDKVAMCSLNFSKVFWCGVILRLFGQRWTRAFYLQYGGKGISEHFRITHNSIVLSPQTIKMVVISPRIIQTK